MAYAGCDRGVDGDIDLDLAENVTMRCTAEHCASLLLITVRCSNAQFDDKSAYVTL